MEEIKQINWTANAFLMVSEIYNYLEIASGEKNAEDYVEDLLEFGNTLSTKSTHFSFCRNPILQHKGYRCAPFRKTYILIYSETQSTINILAVVHAKRSPDFFAEL